MAVRCQFFPSRKRNFSPGRGLIALSSYKTAMASLLLLGDTKTIRRNKGRSIRHPFTSVVVNKAISHLDLPKGDLSHNYPDPPRSAFLLYKTLRGLTDSLPPFPRSPCLYRCKRFQVSRVVPGVSEEE